jgi:hypothetical protein
MSTAQPPTTTPALRDQSTGLMLFGIFQILLGCLCVLMTLMMIGAGLMPPVAGAPHGQAVEVRMMVPAAGFYLVLAATFIWLGVGSILARRWAWTLTVILSWLWLLMGVAGCVMFAVAVRPMMSAAMAQQGKMPPEAIVVMQIVMGVVLACIYVLLPALFLVFYQRASVRATCRQRDPHVRWTDRCPMPVLALSIMLAWCVVSMPFGATYGWVMPLFGGFVSGAVGAAVSLSLMLVLAYVAWGTYRLQMAAWWGALLLSIAGTVNMLLTFSRTNLMEMYERMRMPAAQLEMMRKSGLVESMSNWAPWIGLVGGAVFLGYLLYVRRYFVGGIERSLAEKRCYP